MTAFLSIQAAHSVKQTWAACQHRADVEYNWQPLCRNACPLTCNTFGVQTGLLKAFLYQDVLGRHVIMV